MAVLQMQRISICALKKNRKQILEALQRRGVVEITDLAPQDSAFEKADTSQERARSEKLVNQANQALEVLDAYAPVKGSMLDMFAGRQALSEDEFERRAGDLEKAENAVQELNAFSKSIAENKAELVKLQAQLDALEPWMGLDVSMRFEGTRSTAAFIGSIAEELTLDAVYQRLAEAAPELDAVNIDLISSGRDLTCVFVLVPRKDMQKADEALRSIGFIRPASPTNLSPGEQATQLAEQMGKANCALSTAELSISALSDMREPIRFLIDFHHLRQGKYEAASRLIESRRTFLLSGYIPARNAAALEAELTSKFDVAVGFEDPAEDEDAPVALHNASFFRPVEGVLESYALPGKGELDPTSIMAVFYYFLFGLMLSDFAYGAILAIATGILLVKFKNMESGLRNMVKMFCFCGISTACWGIVFSSYFGDVVDVVSRTFFGHEVTIPPLWFVPLDDPMRLLVFCMAVGIVHLFTGLGIQLYQHLKAGRYYEALCKVVFWYMLVGGGIVFGLSTEMVASILQLKFVLPAAVGTVAGWIAIVGAVGIVLTNGDSKNPAVKFAQGLYELYNVTGYLSDILSYSRLLALGLATGVIGSVINQMGAMGGGGIVGAILFILVFLFGHSINFGIELLGAYVHCNRLQYVEFFGKFYEGGGRKFEPFAAQTKYYKFKEENHNV